MNGTGTDDEDGGDKMLQRWPFVRAAGIRRRLEAVFDGSNAWQLLECWSSTVTPILAW